MDRSNLYNVIHLSLSFLLIFMSYNVVQTFQTSSDYAKDGAFAVGIIYLVFCLSNLALSSYITRLLGLRLTLILSSLTYVSFIAANIKYNTMTLYFSAFLLGLGAALLWTSQGVYVAVSINKYERVNNLVSSSTQGFINGIFFGIFQLNLTIGNLIASFLFRLNYHQWIIFTIMTVIAGIGSISLIFLPPIKIPRNTSKRFYNYFI
jgi:MFS family permease